MKKIVFLLFFANLFAGSKEVPFTLEDRDRLIRIETELKNLREYVDKRFEQIDKRFEQIDKRFEQIERRFEQIERRFDQLTTLMLGIVAAFAGIVAVTIGFAIWDRRTALSPYLRRSREIEEREEILEKALKEFAKVEPKMSEILKKLGIL